MSVKVRAGIMICLSLVFGSFAVGSMFGSETSVRVTLAFATVTFFAVRAVFRILKEQP